MDRDSQSEDTLSAMVLENIKSKLIHAFRAAGESRAGRRETAASVRPLSIGRNLQANEELRRAQIDGALTWLRTELVSGLKVHPWLPCRLRGADWEVSLFESQLEMRSQDLQLAQTLLGLNTEIQRLRRESFGGVEVDSDRPEGAVPR